MDNPQIATVSYDMDADLYYNGLARLRRVAAEFYFLMVGIMYPATENPIWIDFTVNVANDVGEDLAITFRIRAFDLYLCAYRRVNVDDHFWWFRDHLPAGEPDDHALPFNGRYSGSNSMGAKAYDGEDGRYLLSYCQTHVRQALLCLWFTNPRQDDHVVARSLLHMTQFFCEGARFRLISDSMERFWDKPMWGNLVELDDSGMDSDHVRKQNQWKNRSTDFQLTPTIELANELALALRLAQE